MLTPESLAPTLSSLYAWHIDVEVLVEPRLTRYFEIVQQSPRRLLRPVGPLQPNRLELDAAVPEQGHHRCADHGERARLARCTLEPDEPGVRPLRSRIPVQRRGELSHPLYHWRQGHADLP
jgi:hypothetical protein